MKEMLLLAQVKNRDGAVERVLGLIRRKVLPVRQLSLVTTEGGAFEMVFRVDLTDTSLPRLEAELKKVLDVEDILVLEPTPHAPSREFALAQVPPGKTLVPPPGARVVTTGPEGVVVELTGSKAEVDRALSQLRAADEDLRFVRTGDIAIPRPQSSDESNQPSHKHSKP